MESGERRFPQRSTFERILRTRLGTLCFLLALALIGATGCGDDDANADGGTAPPPDGGDGDGDGDGDQPDGGDGDGDGDGDRDAEVDEDAGAPEPCVTHPDCADGQYCNGVELCIDGFCTSGEPVACSALHECDEDINGCDCRDPNIDDDAQDAVECGGNDCNDGNNAIYDGAFETCDALGADEDCNPETFHREGVDGDNDFDEFVSELCFNLDAEGTRHGGDDCDDESPSTSPEGNETCDYSDNDCDEIVDEVEGTGVAGSQHENYYADIDRDGCGDLNTPPQRGCGFSDFPAYVRGEEPCDCDDENDKVNAHADEVCDGIDNDCDELVDDADGDMIEEHHFTATAVDCVDGEWAITTCPDDKLWCTDTVDFGCTTDRFALESCGACETDCKFACGAGCDEVKTIGLGYEHSCATTEQGRATCWGRGADGRLGNDGNRSRAKPVQVIGLDMAVEIAAGNTNTCAITNDELRELYCWGSNEFGQVGNSDPGDGPGTFTTVPLPVIGAFDSLYLSNVVDAAVGGMHVCATVDTGEALCWGSNTLGRLGDSSSNNDYTLFPVFVIRESLQRVTDARSVTSGYDHNCLINSEGGVECWGDNSFAQLGDLAFTEAESATARVVPGLENVSSVMAGWFHTCAISNENVYCWGANDRMQLGRASDETDGEPGLVEGLGQVQAISVGATHTCALSDGDVYCWGGNDAGARGDEDTEDRALPMRLSLPASATDLSIGALHGCALLATEHVYCWGDNFLGALGIGEASQEPVPVPQAIEPLERD